MIVERFTVFEDFVAKFRDLEYYIVIKVLIVTEEAGFHADGSVI